MPQHNWPNRHFLQLQQLSYFFSKKLVLLYLLQFFVFYSCISRDSDVYDLSHFCLHINEDDVRSSSFNHPITLYTEIPQNLCFLPLALECVCTTDMPIPVRPSHTVAMHIPRHAVMSSLVIKHWANMLHSLSLCTSYT